VKLTLAICLGLILASIVHAQEGGSPEYVVGHIISSGLIEGHDQYVLSRLGDAGAVLVTKVLAGGDLTSKRIGSALTVIQDSFADPSLVELTGDRQPRTSLLVLRYLELSTNDAELRKYIVDTRKYIQDRYASSLRPKEP
jgi:hypothetical protein